MQRACQLDKITKSSRGIWADIPRYVGKYYCKNMKYRINKFILYLIFFVKYLVILHADPCNKSYILCLCGRKKKFESFFRDRLTFSNIRSRTSRLIYRLARPLRAPETLSSLSKSRISIFNAHLTLFVCWMMSHNSVSKYRHFVKIDPGTCLGAERRRLQTRLVECRTGKN